MNNAVDNIVMTTSFEKGIKKLKKNHQSDVIADIRDIVKKLAKFEITTQLSNHPLTNSNGQKDIHIRPNIILLYKYTDNGKLLISLELHDIVSHDQLYSQSRKKKFKKSDFKKYHEDINETVEESPKEMSYAYIGNFYVNGIDGDINIGRDSVEVKDIDRRSAINKIIRKFKSTHISFLTAVHNGWRTNVFIDEDKVIENPTDKSLFELEKEYEEENSKERNVDDPKYNYDDEDREGRYEVESLDYGSAEYELNRLNESAYLKQKSSYMVNKDGKVIFVDIMHPYLRQFGFDGETIQEAFQNIFDESETDLSAIRWYYNNTNSEEVKNDIRVLLFNVYRFSKKYPDKIFFNLTKSIVTEFNLSNDLTKLNTFKDVLDLFEKIDNNLNDDFMKVRTSGKYDDNGLDGDIYFRISSNDFDWFDIIYNIVHSNKSWIKYVTIATDHQSPLKNYADVYYKTRDGQLINRMLIDEFLSIEKDPVIESIDSGCAIYELNRLDEGLYDKNGNYAPEKDSKFIRLNTKPINTLTLDEIVYIYAFHFAWYGKNARQFESEDEVIEYVKERHLEDLEKCYEWLHSLKFPLKVYRALNSKETIENVSGRSWTTNPNIYKAGNSIFKNVDNIVSGVISNSSVISNRDTISNFVHYTARPDYGLYGEYEISFKKLYKPQMLSDLQYVNKNEL